MPDDNATDPVDDRVGVTALERGLSILDVLGAAGGGLPLKDLSARVSLSKATVLRLAMSLERFGHLKRDAAQVISTWAPRCGIWVPYSGKT